MPKKRTNPKQMDMFKKPVPKMPEGYYSGDKPNPNLRKFVEDHVAENPYDPETDTYDVPPFDKPITSTKATAIYNMHTYWSKKPMTPSGNMSGTRMAAHHLCRLTFFSPV